MNLAAEPMAHLLTYCRAAEGKETGGVLFGYYTDTHHCAIVSEISAPPADSYANHTRFYRGTRGLKRQLTSLWNCSPRKYYLGEWHYHPYAAPNPSKDDCDQMWKIAVSPEYHCPQPLLVILGGDPHTDWQLSAHLFLKDKIEQCIPLKPTEDKNAEAVSIYLERKHDV